MADFIFLMHGDTTRETTMSDWETYTTGLGKAGVLQGGSAVGSGVTARVSGEPAPVSSAITGFIRVAADDIAHARTMLAGNPVYEAGGTVEIRELPRTD